MSNEHTGVIVADRWVMSEQEEQDERKAHERALARMRQQRKRSRQRHAVTGMVTDRDTGKASVTVTRIAENLSKGMNPSQALLCAGSSRKATQLLDKAKHGLAEVLQSNGVTLGKLVSSVKEGMDATTPMLTQEGCIERPDWFARAKGRDHAIALLDRAGELPAAQAQQGPARVTVVYNHVDLRALPQDLVVSDNVVDAQSDQHELNP